MLDYTKYDNPMPYPGIKDREARRAWGVETHRLEWVVFKEDLEKEHGLEDVPEEVKTKVFAMAWERGHASGLYDVEMNYEELAELITLALKGKNNG